MQAAAEGNLSGIVVGVPLTLGGQFETVSQAKAAIVVDVQQLMVVCQGIFDAVPTKHQLQHRMCTETHKLM